MFLYEDSLPVPARIFALARILCLYVFLSTRELCHVAMVRSAVKKNRRKSQREAARLQKQVDAVLAMEEDEEIHFNRPETVPDTPRVSCNNTPDPEDEDRGEKDYTCGSGDGEGGKR